MTFLGVFFMWLAAALQFTPLSFWYMKGVKMVHACGKFHWNRLWSSRVSHSGEGHGRWTILFKTLPIPIKTDALLEAFPPLTNEATYIWKTPSPLPPLKREAPFHEMIPRKSTINKNLQSFLICEKKFIFSKFAGLQAYSRQLYYQMNFFTGTFRQHFKPPMLPHVLT